MPPDKPYASAHKIKSLFLSSFLILVFTGVLSTVADADGGVGGCSGK